MDIRFHNDKSFMQAHHDEYIACVQQPFYALIDELAPAMLKIDPDMETRPHKVLSRIYRDTRFTRDKSPYRDHLWLAFRKSGLQEKWGQAFYWAEFGPDTLNWGLGLWGEDRGVMNALRYRIVSEADMMGDLLKKLEKRHILAQGQESRRMAVPSAVPAALHPLYRRKSLYFERTGIRYQWAFDEKLTGRILSDFRALRPMWQIMCGCAADPRPEAPALETHLNKMEEI